MKVELVLPANLKACYHLKGEMLDMPSAFSCQTVSWSSSPGCTRAVAGQEVEVSIQGQGGKHGNEGGNAFHKQQDSWNGSRLEIFLKIFSRVLCIGRGWGNTKLPSAIPHVLCFCHRVPECVGARWVCEWWCWVGACSRFIQETQIISKFWGNITNSKYISLCSLEKQGNTFSRKQLIFFFIMHFCVRLRDYDQSLW